MKRTSNLAFNREFPAKTGLTGFKKDNTAVIRRDRANPFDSDAVGIFLPGFDEPAGWLFKKDSNRQVVLDKIQDNGAIDAHIESAPAGSKVKFVVVFWL
jgi:hypothetical protein